MNNEKTVCRTPTPGGQPTRIDSWKFDLIREAILKAVPKRGEGVQLRALPAMVRRHLSPKDLESLGSVGWYTTTVKLELEVRGELTRLANTVPQRLLRR
jgi:hypothetical protein